MNKIIGLAEAAAMVPDGATISFGGFTTQRHPMAFVYELIRLKRRNLYLFGHSPGGDWDILIGAGCVKRVELAYEADEALTRLDHVGDWRFSADRSSGKITATLQWYRVFSAGAMGIPFMPIRSLLGSDLLTCETLNEAQRKDDVRTSSKKLHVMESPFVSNDRIVLVPAIHTEFAVLHVQKATANGTIRIEGQSFADIQQALCADTVIITTEEIVEEDILRQEPERNPLPFFVVKHVCQVPFGAHPYAVFNYYDYDPYQLKQYHEAANDDVTFKQYLDHFVYEVKSFNEYLACVGGASRLECLKADPKYGYKPDLRRRQLG